MGNIENIQSYRALRFNKDNVKVLSNFDRHAFDFMGHTFTSAEAAFQACKLIDGEDTTRFDELVEEFVESTPSAAKKMGRKVKLCRDWEQVKATRMYAVLSEKFRQNPDLIQVLLDTGESFIIEDTTWHDNTWGLCECGACFNKKKSKNILGLLLMKLRAELRGEQNCKVKYWLKGEYASEGAGYIDLMSAEDVQRVLDKYNLDDFDEFMKKMV